MEIKAYAKINLGLEVLGKRADNNHEVSMIMQSISLHDIIRIEKRNDKKIVISSNKASVPTDSTNLAYKAYKILMDKYDTLHGADIFIDKQIPVAAGLAGGSSDCAAVLAGTSELYGLKIDDGTLLELGLSLGADVPFCMLGGTYLAEGKGEKLTKISPMPECYIVVAKPDISLLTGEIYKGLGYEVLVEEELEKRRALKPMENLIRCIEKKDLSGISKNLFNRLEEVSIKKAGIIKEIKETLVNEGAMSSLMSGSGPSVFGIFENEDQAKRAANQVKSEFRISEVYVCKPI